jgi:DNA polymerase III subunit beta
MKLSIPKSELQRALARIQAIVERRNSMPILANVLLEARKEDGGSLIVAATDLEVGVRSSQTAKVAKAGALTVSARKLYDIVRELPDEPVDLQGTANSYLELQCGRARFSLAGTTADEYPSLPEFPSDRLVRLPAAVLSVMIERTIYAASVDETRYNLNGAYIEVDASIGRLRMVATDGHRLAQADRAIGPEVEGLASGVIVPRKGLTEVKRLVDEDDADEVEMGFAGSSGLVRRGGVTLVMRLIEGEFPDYRKVIPPAFEHSLTVPAELLVHALRRVSVLSSERSRAVKLELAERRLVVSSNNPDLGEAQEELDVDYEGPPISIGFNVRYLLDALGSLGAKEVRLGLRDGNAPAQLQPTDDADALAIVMPMRL